MNPPRLPTALMGGDTGGGSSAGEGIAAAWPQERRPAWNRCRSRQMASAINTKAGDCSAAEKARRRKRSAQQATPTCQTRSPGNGRCDGPQEILRDGPRRP